MLKARWAAAVALGIGLGNIACQTNEFSTPNEQPHLNAEARPSTQLAGTHLEPPASAPAKELTLDLGDEVTLKLVLIPAGRFLMGSPKDEVGRRKYESPQVEVTISKPFYMGVYEVTRDQYGQYLKANGLTHRESIYVWRETGNHPAVAVYWHEAQAFCEWLSQKTGRTVMLPTEAQWEYACRAGSQTRFGFGDDDAALREHAWYAANSRDPEIRTGTTHPVGQKKPNAWGLYDMHGNAQEWCTDWFGPDHRDKVGATDPTGPVLGGPKVMKGGAWDDPGMYCRSATRVMGLLDRVSYSFGLRVVAAVEDEDWARSP